MFFSNTGPPELKRKSRNESHVSYVLYGVPKPKITWGYMENDTKYSINGTTRLGMDYAHDYFMGLESGMCERIIYFRAVGYYNKTDSWNATFQINCKLFFAIFFASSRICPHSGYIRIYSTFP